MADHAETALVLLVQDNESEIVSEWVGLLTAAGQLQTGRLKAGELQTECRNFLSLFRRALNSGGTNINDAGWAPMRDFLADITRARAIHGFSPSETATFVCSLKQPLFNRLRSGAATVAEQAWSVTRLIDDLGLFVMEVYQKAREEVIIRQQREIAELSTPVVKLWEGILALPLIGTLDSQRTQVVMENLLQSIVDQGAEIAIIDITGVPTVDTLTAQHLLKTVAAARLMGADCIISGIRPQIAQTLVHLGVELNVVSKASLADAFALALRRIGRTVVAVRTPVAVDPGTGDRSGPR
jgi:rsbT co-antagonist protein RsbR